MRFDRPRRASVDGDGLTVLTGGSIVVNYSHVKETVSASHLKAKCAEVLDRVERHKTSLIVTRRGRPIARLVPFEKDASLALYGSLSGSVRFWGDVIEPLEVEWEAKR